MSTDHHCAAEEVTKAERLANEAALRASGFFVRLLARAREEGEDIWAEANVIRRSPAASSATEVSEGSAARAAESVRSLPLVGATTVEDGIFYTVVGAVAISGLVSWPTAALIGTGHALHQRARNVVRTGTVGEAREALIEAFEDVV